MAVANVTLLDSSFPGENRSPASRHWGDQVRSTTRTSSILQMWRELERERVLSCPSRNDESIDQFEGPHLPEVQVRSDVSNVLQVENCARSEWLGENECERVRIVREWIEMTTEQRETPCGHRDEQDAGFNSQIERVRDGLLVDRCELGGRRAMRKLCGRQALIDLLARTASERKRELQCLSENRPVSDFAHRNRIQSLLKGRFLRNGTMVQEKRPTSIAASELGLLRQRQTVSGLREGFLSRSDSNAHSPRAQSETSFNSDLSDHRDEQTQVNDLQDIPDEISEEFEDTNTESDHSGFQSDDFENSEHGDTRLEEVTALVDGRQEQLLASQENEQAPSSVGFLEGQGDDAEVIVVNGWSEEMVGAEVQAPLQQEQERLHEHSEPIRDDREVDQVSDVIDSLQDNAGGEDYNWQEELSEVGELQESNQSVTGNEDWYQLSHENSNEWYQEIGDNLHESDEWNENNVDETPENWLDEPSHRTSAPIALTDAFYSSDDDNGHHLELRQLLSRRRVSNLLQSGFRESLNQLIQSYVERQGHASDDWELDRISPSPGSINQPGDDQGLQRDENAGEREVDRTELILPSPAITPPQNSWEQDVHGESNWQHSDIHQRLGTEWEMINDLRIDMVRLQQKMDNMQRMLEACMDMQLELQRSVRQEVSAALNRKSSGPAAGCAENLIKEEANWGHVRQGLCCMCGENHINALLYRCGHMCTCLRCAEKLLDGREMCPMCHAPILEVIRAYPIN